MGSKFYVFFDYDDGLPFESSRIQLVGEIVHWYFLFTLNVVFLPWFEGFKFETIGVAKLTLHSLVAISNRKSSEST
jgi:hypothetical protein